ncbi:MAG: hypothetical protein HS126_21650 [Anaerolineales bacterium]|nr:hypothetical protein [Anaerolineales bacterium]
MQREIDRLEGNIPRLILPCGCKIEQHDYSAIMVKYCARHVSFHYSPHHEKAMSLLRHGG